ncbi:DoxX family protein [Paenibacillus bovis]|uniref:Oxidoreductase n=1 Tax=Paenibacillus bovis TaxID=1616788 RepID=A0A172ZEN5_9BACL|nr:DoxX family protein [Paenibacillus bovis]ANF96105.1 oxidoreductase [Paenibacillus bovis]
MLSMGLLLIRVVIGVIFAAHGAQKLFGWFGGFGPKGTGGWMESLGIKPGVAAAVAAGLVELLGGLAFAAGLFTPIMAVLLSLTMVMAIVKVHAPNGFWNTAGGYEFNLILIVVLIGIALTGAGSYSLDALL